jgi:DNA-binding beta-propeller fold protein YncE
MAVKKNQHKAMRALLAGSVVCLLLVTLQTYVRAAPAGDLGALFVKVADVPIGEKTSRFDYESLDAKSGHLYVSKMDAGKLDVFDVRTQRLVTERDGFPKITGVLAVPALDRVYASVPGAGIGASLSVGLGMAGLSSGRGAIAILDSQTLKEIARVPGGVFPDGIAYDPDDRRVFVSDELGSAVTAIEPDGRTRGRIAMGGEVGNVQYDPETHRIYAPVQSRNELGVIDPAAPKLVDRFSLPGCDHPHGLRIARGGAIAYAACDENDRLLAIDLKARKVTGSLPLGHDPDVLAGDPNLKRLYIASESGVLTVVDTTDPAAPQQLGEVFVGDNAHSVAVDPATHYLYLPLRDLGGHAVMRVLMPKMK